VNIPAQVTIGPQKGPQYAFSSSDADICIFGGAAGGGKTFGLLLEPLRHVGNPGFGAVIFRRTYPEIMMEGGLWDEAEWLYPLLGATSHLGRMEWTFPGGARVRFAHLQYDKDVRNFQGAQIALLGFDQLEHFTEKQFWYMLSRNRSTCGVRPYCRATCNPDPDSFVADLVAWWIADDGFADLSRAGILRWFVRIGGRLEWANSRQALVDKFGPESRPMSLTFIPSSVYDNLILLEKDPDYLAKLRALTVVEQARLLGDPERGGNWHIRPEAGKVFNRDQFEIVDAVPAGGTECRFWDFAATEKEVKGDEPAATASVKMRRVGDTYYILDCTAEFWAAGIVHGKVKNLALQDAAKVRGTGTRYQVRWEIEPGSASKRENVDLVKLLAGLDAKGIRPQGDKLTRALPLARQAEANNVKLLRGPWNEKWLNHMHNQPDIREKDIMDASSGAFTALTSTGWARGAAS